MGTLIKPVAFCQCIRVYARLTDEGFPLFFVMISERHPPPPPFPLLACMDSFFSCWSLLYVQGAGATSVYVDVSVMSTA